MYGIENCGPKISRLGVNECSHGRNRLGGSSIWWGLCGKLPGVPSILAKSGVLSGLPGPLGGHAMLVMASN